jgi:hypothetical protein
MKKRNLPNQSRYAIQYAILDAGAMIVVQAVADKVQAVYFDVFIVLTV